MKRYFNFLLLFLFPVFVLCQSAPEIMAVPGDQDCLVGYDSIYNLQNRAYRIFADSIISVDKKIRLSKKLAQEGLDVG